MNLEILKNSFKSTNTASSDLVRLFKEFLDIYDKIIPPNNVIHSFAKIKDISVIDEIFNKLKNKNPEDFKKLPVNKNFQEIIMLVKDGIKNNIAPSPEIIYNKIYKEVGREVEKRVLGLISKNQKLDIIQISKRYYENKLDNNKILLFIDRISMSISTGNLEGTKSSIKIKMIEFNNSEMKKFIDTNDELKKNKSFDLDDLLKNKEKLKENEHEIDNSNNGMELN